MRETNPLDFRLSESRINPFNVIFRNARPARAGVFRARLADFENLGGGFATIRMLTPVRFLLLGNHRDENLYDSCDNRGTGGARARLDKIC